MGALILCGANRADRLMVSGKWLVEDGKAIHIDEANLIDRHSQAAKKMRRIAGLET